MAHPVLEMNTQERAQLREMLDREVREHETSIERWRAAHAAAADTHTAHDALYHLGNASELASQARNIRRLLVGV